MALISRTKLFFDLSIPIRLRKRVKQDILQEVNLTLFKSRHETIDGLLKEHKSTRGEITKEFFDLADPLVRLNWMKDLAGMLQIDKYKKDRDKRAEEGWIAD